MKPRIKDTVSRSQPASVDASLRNKVTQARVDKVGQDLSNAINTQLQQHLRTSADRNRPLLQGGNLMEKLQKLRDDRDPLYTALADHILDTDDRTPNNVAQSIQRKLNLTR